MMNGQPQVVDSVDVNGRIAELSEWNSALMGRCAALRGALATKEREIANLRALIAPSPTPPPAVEEPKVEETLQ